MENERQNYNKIPLPTDADIPHLKSQEELDKEFLEQFELDPTKEDEPIQYCFDVGGIPTSPKGDIQGNKGQQAHSHYWHVFDFHFYQLRKTYKLPPM